MKKLWIRLNTWLENKNAVLGAWSSLLQIVIFPAIFITVIVGYFQLKDYIAKPDLHLEFKNVKAMTFTVVNRSNVLAEKPSYGFGIFDLDSNPINTVPIPWKETSYLRGNSVKSLRHAVQAFKRWLEREIKVKAWLPSIELETTVRIQRQQFIKICGDISKHNFSRLSRRVEDLKKILSLSGVELSDEDGLLMIDDFYEKFHTDIFSYHGSHIVELLNNIRWGIHEYLQPEFRRSIIYEEGTPPRYSYTYPSGVDTQFAKNCYWTLMNEVRATPYVKRFKTYKILKRRY